MTEQELKEPGKLHLLTLARCVLGKQYTDKQFPHPCYKRVAIDLLMKYKTEKLVRTIWMLIAFVNTAINIVMMIGG